MRDRALRAIAECRHIAAMTEDPGRITRRYLTPPMRSVHAHLRARMEAMGMRVSVDAAGNLRGVWQPLHASGRRLLMGSHVDTVPDAGAFDGVLGVALALEMVAVAQELALPLAIEVIAFSEEEGVRFAVPFIGSRAVAGRIETALLALNDAEGITLETAIRDFGLDPGQMEEAVAGEGALAFVEFHIEQGPVLEAEGLSLAAVTGIVGQTRLSVEFTGQANHAGTTPMHLRRDALAAAAEWITAVETLALHTEGLVATVGKISVAPNAGNVIPGTALVSIDVRHLHDSVRKEVVDALLAQAEAIAARRGLTLQCTRQVDQPAAPMDERLTAFLAEAIEAAGLPVKRMPSGAGHDAMVMASRMPAAMLFLRSPRGISHHPAETVREEDVEAALHVGRNFLARLAAEIG
ncbi:MAG: allantoate amidohydrolase [Acidobacteriota bacterium]|nr:allantoate amidohydrolase [Acidobacteriota bacterium]